MVERASLLAISDIHIGCPRSDPYRLKKKIEKYLYPTIKGNNILFICGDFFDTLLNLSSGASFVAMEIIQDLRMICVENGCDLRILRGTFTHDRNQPRHFINGYETEQNEVRLFETLSVEHHEKTGLDILYIPDNIVSDDIYRDIRTLLDNHGIEKVDILVHHGYFKHMLPDALLTKGVPNGCLDADLISRYVKGCVLNGHVHISSVYRNVISIGSFDRLAHGEEERKGFYRITIDNDVYRFNFIENEDASKFITYNLLPYDYDSAITKFSEKFGNTLKSLKDNEPLRIRIISNDTEVIENCRQMAKNKYKNLMVDQYSVIKRDQAIENIVTNLEELPQITEDNLVDLLMPIIQKQGYKITETEVKRILQSVRGNTKQGGPENADAGN